MHCLLLAATLSCSAIGQGADPKLREHAIESLRRATDFFRTEVAVQGGYVWRYSDDLSKREGEGKTTATVAWMQPPGTPSVGAAYLAAYDATGDRRYLDAARETAGALVQAQLRSGGWYYFVDFDPANRRKLAYRKGGGSKGRNTTTLDDNVTQSALRLLMHVDRSFEFRDETIHEAAKYALESLLRAQYPNGAWAQAFDSFPDPAKHPVQRASFPPQWSRTWLGGDYWHQYTLNDNALADTIEIMFEAARVYSEAKYGDAARRAGDFILLAQLPEPQPVWAQQYNFDMHPAWARKFEPPSVTGGESQRVLRTLMMLYREIGEAKYLEPIPAALDYLRRSQLSDGRLARFYELETNKPLYFTRQYELTYDDSDLPTHYGFKVNSSVDAIEREFTELKKVGRPSRDSGERITKSRPKVTGALEKEVRTVIANLDERGRWIDSGSLKYHGKQDSTHRIIDCQTFVKNVETLSRYLAATRPD